MSDMNRGRQYEDTLHAVGGRAHLSSSDRSHALNHLMTHFLGCPTAWMSRRLLKNGPRHTYTVDYIQFLLLKIELYTYIIMYA